MAGGRTVALLCGFAMGSVATVAAISLAKKKTKRKKLLDQGTRSRSLSLPLPAVAISSQGQQINFLSDMLDRLWKRINVAGSAMIRETVEPMFADMLPGPLANLHFTKIDLGTIPIRLDNIVVHEVKRLGDQDTLQFDLDVIWDSACDIQLHADYVGSFGVKSMQLKGRMTFLLKPITNELPCFAAIQYGFINPPELDLDFTGLASVADFGGIDKSVREVLHSTLASMVVLPNRMLYKMDLGSNFMDIYQPPVGAARITAVGGRGFQVEQRTLRSHDVPDVYCVLKLGDMTCRTSTIKDSLSPSWNETFDFILYDHDQVVRLHAWDEDNGPLDSNDDLGSAEVTLGELLLAGKTKEVELQNEDQEPTGAFVTLHCDVCDLSLTDTTSLENAPTKQKGACGLLTILVTRAFDLGKPRKEAESFVKVTYGAREFVTGVVTDLPGYDALNPTYDCCFQVPLTSDLREKSGGFPAVVFTLMNGDENLGVIQVSHSSLLALPTMAMSERRKIGKGGASLEFRLSLAGIEERSDSPPSEISSPVASRSANVTAGGMGTVRVSLLSGHGFNSKKKKRFGKRDVPDVYCKLKFGSSPAVWRSATIKDSVNPVWKENKEYVLSNHNQMVQIDAFDSNRKGPDDNLGSVRITVGKLLLSAGETEVELEKNGVGTGAFVHLRVDKTN